MFLDINFQHTLNRQIFIYCPTDISENFSMLITAWNSSFRLSLELRLLLCSDNSVWLILPWISTRKQPCYWYKFRGRFSLPFSLQSSLICHQCPYLSVVLLSLLLIPHLFFVSVTSGNFPKIPQWLKTWLRHDLADLMELSKNTSFFYFYWFKRQLIAKDHVLATLSGKPT